MGRAAKARDGGIWGGVFRSIPGNVTERAGDIRDSSRHCRCVSLVADYAISIALQHEAVCRVPTLYRRDPRRARIGARNSFLSIGIPTADLRFYPAALLVPFQEKIGSGIGFAAARGRGLDEDDRCALGRIRVAEQVRTNSPVTASKEFVGGV